MFVNNVQSNWNLYVLKLTGLKDKRPVFKVYKPWDWDTPIKEVSWVVGVYDGIEFIEKTIKVDGKSKKIQEIKVHLSDTDEHYIIQTSLTSVARNLLNKLINVKKWNVIEIIVWVYNDRNYIVVKRWQEKIQWALPLEEVKKLTKSVTINWETQYDYSELIKTLVDKNEKFVKDEPIEEENEEEVPF